eukprot:4387092-Amphidinium_carterae.1
MPSFPDQWEPAPPYVTKATRWDPPEWLQELEAVYPERGRLGEDAPARAAANHVGLPLSQQGPSLPRRQVSISRFGPGHTITSFTVRPEGHTLHWCSVCGAYAEASIASLKWACPGFRKSSAAA